MRPCWYAFQGVACILSPYGAFTEQPPALPGDVYSLLLVIFLCFVWQATLKFIPSIHWFCFQKNCYIIPISDQPDENYERYHFTSSIRN